MGFKEIRFLKKTQINIKFSNIKVNTPKYLKCVYTVSLNKAVCFTLDS